MPSMLESRSHALAAVAAGALLAAGCSSGAGFVRPDDSPGGRRDAWELPAPSGNSRDPGRPALVIHSAGIDALLADPRDAGLRRALALLDERLLELPAELGQAAPPPGLLEFLCEFLSSPWTLELDVSEGQSGPLPVNVRARWTVHAASAERATALKTRFEGLLALLALPSASAANWPELTEVETPAGSLFYGAQVQDHSFVIAWGEPTQAAVATSSLELPAGIAPAWTVELELSKLAAPFENLLALADSSGVLRKQLEAAGLFGDAPLGLSFAVGHAADRAHIVSRYRNWARMARDSGALVSEPLPREAFELVPADATLVSLSRSEPLAILSAFEHFGGEFEGELRAHVQTALGLDLGPDLLEPLGQTFGLYLSDTTGGGGLASAVLFVALDDEERLKRSLEVLAERLNDHALAELEGRVRVRSFEHRGTSCLGLTVPGLPVPLEPSLAIRRRHLFVGATPQALAAALDHARGDAAGLRAHPGLRGLAPGALDDLQGLFFSDVPRLARDGYGLAGMLTSALANAVRSNTDELREPGLVLPPYRELLAGARPTLLLARLQGDDLVTVGQGDRSAVLHLAATLGWTPSVLAGLALGGGLAATLAVPPVVESLVEAQETKVQADIWALMNALHSYAIQNSGQYPESLEPLVVPDENGFTFLNSEVLQPDPWGNPYVYELTDKGPHVFSYGADGVPGGEGPDRDVDSFELEDEMMSESMGIEDSESEELEPEEDG